MNRVLSLVPWLTAATVVGCAPVPTWRTAREYRVLAVSPQDATFGCVVALTDSLGYTVRASDRSGGFVRVDQVVKDATEVAVRCGGGPLTVWSDTARA